MEKKGSIYQKPLMVLLFGCLCNLLWGSAIPFINLGYQLFSIPEGDTATIILFAGCRFFLAGVLTIAFSSIPQKKLLVPRKDHWGNVAKLGCVQTILQYVLFYIGVAHTASVKASLIQGLNAFIAILVAVYLFRSERMNGLKWLGGVLGVVGVAIINLDGRKIDAGMSFMGEGFLMLSSVASACSAGLIKRYGQDENPVAMSGWQFMFGGVVMALCGFLAGGRLHPTAITAVFVLLYLAALSATAYTLWAVLLRENPVSRVAVTMFLQPVFGVLLGLLLVEANPNPPLLRYGIALVLVCMSIYVVGKGQQKDA